MRGWCVCVCVWRGGGERGGERGGGEQGGALGVRLQRSARQAHSKQGEGLQAAGGAPSYQGTNLRATITYGSKPCSSAGEGGGGVSSARPRDSRQQAVHPLDLEVVGGATHPRTHAPLQHTSPCALPPHLLVLHLVRHRGVLPAVKLGGAVAVLKVVRVEGLERAGGGAGGARADTQRADTARAAARLPRARCTPQPPKNTVPNAGPGTHTPPLPRAYAFTRPHSPAAGRAPSSVGPRPWRRPPAAPPAAPRPPPRSPSRRRAAPRPVARRWRGAGARSGLGR